MVYRRGKTWWFKFTFSGELIRESTRQTNKRTAEQIEAARKTQLAKGEVGIKDRAAVPTFAGFKDRFTQAIEIRCANKPRTIAFYKEKLKRVLEYGPIASARLDEIDESLIEGYVQERRSKVGVVTVNRQLATLRRALRLAQEWKIIDRVPRIRLLPGEPIREFVLNQDQEKNYLAATPQPLHDIGVMILDTGLRLGEALSLEWRDMHLEPGVGARYGYLQVRDGKTRNAKRTVSLTGRVRAMLEARRTSALTPLVFSTVNAVPYLGTYLNRLHQKARETVKLPSVFVLHSLRHTMLTRLGEAGVDAFTIMRIAGHSSITVSQRYVHPSSEAMERAIEKLEKQNAGTLHGVGTDSGTAPVLPIASKLVKH
ncbi:MAG TPA: site-specific integrase [Bryobacteraceae bacterium]|nr:site-specific integrase [Bryobacteraceae bacterium]